MSPLISEEYAPGRTVRNPDGKDHDVVDAVTMGSGNRYLFVRDPDTLDTQFIPESDVRDEWEARDPQAVREDRENRAQDTPPQDPGATDVPGVTVPQSEAQSTPQAQDPAPGPDATGTPGTNPNP